MEQHQGDEFTVHITAGEYSGAGVPSTDSSQLEAGPGDGETRHPVDAAQQAQQVTTTTTSDSRLNAIQADDQAATPMGVVAFGCSKDDSWSCVAIVFTFCLFVSLVTILGVYGTVTLIVGPNSSILIKPNSYLVEYLKMEKLYEGNDGGEMLAYELNNDPALDVVLTWTDTHTVTLQSTTTHKEWIYYFNQGSELNISYTLNSNASSASLILVIAQGYEGLLQWLENPSYPNDYTLHWQAIQGNGMIEQEIYTSSSYYVALGNLNEEAVSVELKMRIRSLVYNTSGAYEKCSFRQGSCSVKISMGGGNAALLTSPGPVPGRAVNEWYVKLSYGPRWIIYLSGTVGLTIVALLGIHILSPCIRIIGLGISTRLGRFGVRSGGDDDEDERAHLLPHPSKDDDDLSSYDSVTSQEEEEVDDGKSPKLLDIGDKENNIRRLCSICFDAPRECFFLPCGHSVACYSCATRIAEAGGTCPICRRPMKKVRKIFTV